MEFAVCRLHLKNFPARRLRFPSSGRNVGKPTPGKSFRWFIARSAGICVNSSPQNTIRLLSTECKRSRTFIAGELWLITVRISARNVCSPWQLRLRWHATVAETILSLQRESRFSFCVVCSRYDRLFLDHSSIIWSFLPRIFSVVVTVSKNTWHRWKICGMNCFPHVGSDWIEQNW